MVVVKKPQPLRTVFIPQRKIIKGHKQRLRVTKWLLVRDVQVPNITLGGEKRELVQQLLGSFWAISEGTLSW